LRYPSFTSKHIKHERNKTMPRTIPRSTPNTKELALHAAVESGICRAHGDTRQANAFYRAALILLDTPAITPIHDGSVWEVPSQHEPTVRYTVRRYGGVYACNCPAGMYGKPCKHVALVETLASQ
jgi:hypothetical protein